MMSAATLNLPNRTTQTTCRNQARDRFWISALYAKRSKPWRNDCARRRQRAHRGLTLPAQKGKLPFELSRFPADSPWFLTLAQVIPGYGPKAVRIVGGMYHVLLWYFVWTAAILNAIGALVFAFSGQGLKTLL